MKCDFLRVGNMAIWDAGARPRAVYSKVLMSCNTMCILAYDCHRIFTEAFALVACMVAMPLETAVRMVQT